MRAGGQGGGGGVFGFLLKIEGSMRGGDSSEEGGFIRGGGGGGGRTGAGSCREGGAKYLAPKFPPSQSVSSFLVRRVDLWGGPGRFWGGLGRTSGEPLYCS